MINATLSGRDCFAILPTGAGKSLLFQLPGMIAESGLTVVVSPLVALMTDQVASLKAKTQPTIVEVGAEGGDDGDDDILGDKFKKAASEASASADKTKA